MLAVLGGVVVTDTPQCPGSKCQVVAAPRDLAASDPVVPTSAPAVLSIAPTPGADKVNPAGPVMITATSGTITDVTMVNDSGKEIPGVLTPDGTAWKPTSQLGYDRTYSTTILARGPQGMPSRQTASFTTLSPSNQTQVYLETVAGGLMQDGATYGIGTVVVAHFDEAIDNKANAERHLSVTTNPPVPGSWYWTGDTTAHWRPEKYYAPGTTVTVNANIYGTPLGDGLYGAEDEKVSFRIGDAHVSIADDVTKQVSVFNNGQLVRTMPTSMGMGGTQTIDGTTLSFFTPPGVYTVMDKANPVIMDSSTFGLPVNSRLGYRETIAYATRISSDGIYLHQLNATVWAQGNTDTSHGCLNLNGDNAKWFFDFSVAGDVVERAVGSVAPRQQADVGAARLGGNSWPRVPGVPIAPGSAEGGSAHLTANLGDVARWGRPPHPPIR
jgi:lipoprotein-anchoring transpeptidase ErfK/SrfK